MSKPGSSSSSAAGLLFIPSEVPLILFKDSKHPIIVPPSIADLLRDKPQESDLGYMEEDDDETSSAHLRGAISFPPDLELDDDEALDLSGVEVREVQQSDLKGYYNRDLDEFFGNGGGGVGYDDNDDEDFLDWDCFWGQLKSSGPRLVPFLKTLALYFVIFIPEERPSYAGMVLKVLPVLSLALFVLLHGMSLGDG
jgi:hypothetical protein